MATRKTRRITKRDRLIYHENAMKGVATWKRTPTGARRVKRMYVSIGASLSLVITIIVLIVMIISKSSLTFIPMLAIVFIELWVIYSFEIINLDAQKSWVATLNLPKYYDIVKIIREIPSDNVKTKKEGRP